MFGPPADDSLHVSVATARADRYSLYYSPESVCPGGLACRIASVAGARITPTTPSPPPGRRLIIGVGWSGVYVPRTCGGAGCAEPLLWWEDHGSRYSVGLKAGTPAKLIRMARSMVDPCRLDRRVPCAAPAGGSASFRSRVVAAAAAIAPRLTIPVRVPLVVSGAPDDDSTFVTVRTARADAYDVVLGDTNCSGATYCRTGRVTGQRITPGTRRPRGVRVSVAGVGRATFEASVCGANCSDAVLTWDRDGVRYAVGLKAGELADLERVARSVVRVP